jgi:hypothetical protein
MTCELCKREVDLTEHHLIPREMHNKKWCKRMFESTERKHRKAYICHDCHSAVHKFIDNKELAKEFNTVGKLLQHQDVKKFVKWVSRKKQRKFKC